MRLRTLFEWSLIVFVGGFFLLAGASKLPDIPAFYASILNYQLVDAQLAWLAALFLPYLEICAALALVHPRTRPSGGAILLGLLLFFELALGSAILRGLDIDCGCTGGSSTSATAAFIRNGVLILALAILHCLALPPRRSRPTAPATQS